MALQWINVFDIPDVYISGSAEVAARFDTKVFEVDRNGVVSGFFAGLCSPGANRAQIGISNTPAMAGYTFTGRQRVTVLMATSTGGGGPWPAHVHHIDNGAGGVDVPTGEYIADASSAPCIADLVLDGTSGGYYSLATHGGRRSYTWVDSQLYRWRLELEVDYDPPPPPPFWQDFIGCKEITP